MVYFGVFGILVCEFVDCDVWVVLGCLDYYKMEFCGFLFWLNLSLFGCFDCVLDCWDCCYLVFWVVALRFADFVLVNWCLVLYTSGFGN